MCGTCGKPNDLVGYYRDEYDKVFTIEQCKRCKGLTHNLVLER